MFFLCLCNLLDGMHFAAHNHKLHLNLLSNLQPSVSLVYTSFASDRRIAVLRYLPISRMCLCPGVIERILASRSRFRAHAVSAVFGRHVAGDKSDGSTPHTRASDPGTFSLSASSVSSSTMSLASLQVSSPQPPSEASLPSTLSLSGSPSSGSSDSSPSPTVPGKPASSPRKISLDIVFDPSA